MGRHHLVTQQSSWEGVTYNGKVCGEIEFRKAAKFIGRHNLKQAEAKDSRGGITRGEIQGKTKFRKAKFTGRQLRKAKFMGRQNSEIQKGKHPGWKRSTQTCNNICLPPPL